MRQGGIRKEPEYRRKQQEASEREQYAQHQEDVIRTVVSVRASIDSMVTEHAANRKQTATHEHSKRNREWATFWALVTAVGAAILTLIVAHCDNRAIISEAQQVADQQHKDTLAALDKTEASIATLKEQTTTMRSQLTEMHQASVDIAELVKSANDTEERQLRAYVGITGDITLHCFSCNIKTFYPFSPPHSI